MFTDVQFMTAKEKELTLKAWRTFLRHGLKREHFVKRLYEHLHLHCGFIAHYNLHGFYSTYFQAGHDTERFFDAFCDHRAGVDYEDLNTVMREEYARHRDRIARQAEEDIAQRLELLEACVRRAKADREFARQFLGRINTWISKGMNQ